MTPPKMDPSVVYIVKGEGVRDNSWEVQEPTQRVIYTNPPIEQLDSVPTPLSTDLSIRIFDKSTKPVPDFFQPRRIPPTPKPSPANMSHPSTNAVSKTPNPPHSRSDPRPHTQVSSNLRNFRRLSVHIIANPNQFPFATPVTTVVPPSSQQPHPSLVLTTAQERAARAVATAPSATKPVPPRAPVSPTAPKGKPQAAPAVPQLALPGPSSPLKTIRQPPQITSPSAFGRWKSSAQVTTTEQRSPTLPSPTKHRPTAAADKARAKPWEKIKMTSPSAQATVEVQRKAMDTIVAKARSHQPKHAKNLPPLTPLTPPVPRPSQAGPVSPRVPPTTAVAKPVSKHGPPSPTKAEAPGRSTQVAPQRPVQKPAQQRPPVDVRTEVKTDDAVVTHVKAPAVQPPTVPKEPTRRLPMPAPSTVEKRREPPKPTERELAQKEVQKPSKAVTSRKGVTAKPGAIAKPPESVSAKPVTQPVKAATDLKPTPSPRSSIDGEIGTAARPIVTKADLLEARQSRRAAAVKAPRVEKPAQVQASSKDVRTEKGKRPTTALPVPTPPSAQKVSEKTPSGELVDSEIQETMKGVLEEVVRTVQLYKRKHDISLHDEMKSKKKRILRFIQTHLEEAASLEVDSAVQKPSAETDGALKKQDSLSGKEPAKKKEGVRPVNVREVNTYEMFKSWRRQIEKENLPLQRLAVEAKQLAQTVENTEPKTLYFSVSELLTRLKELTELAVTIRHLKRMLAELGKEIASHEGRDARVLSQFQDAFNIVKWVGRWASFLSEQTKGTRKKLLRESSKEVKTFCSDVYRVVVLDAAKDEAAGGGIVKVLRVTKSILGKLEGQINLPDDAESVTEMLQDTVSWFAPICKEGSLPAESETTALPANQDRAAPSSTAGLSDAIPRRPRHEEKSESAKRKAGGPSSSSALQSSATQKPMFEPRERSRTLNGAAAAMAAPNIPTSPKSLPDVPRRPPGAEAPASVAAAQAGPSTQTSAAGSTPRWLNVDRPNLRSLMQSARTVDQVHDDRSGDSAASRTKRKAEDEGNQRPSDADPNQPSRKRRVRFAPTLVKGEQSSSYTREDVACLFWDGYDLLSDASKLQANLREERTSKLTRGDVIATLGFITSYLTVLNADRVGRTVNRPVRVPLPYTPSLKREISRWQDRRANSGNGFQDGRDFRNER